MWPFLIIWNIINGIPVSIENGTFILHTREYSNYFTSLKSTIMTGLVKLVKKFSAGFAFKKKI